MTVEWVVAGLVVLVVLVGLFGPKGVRKAARKELGILLDRNERPDGTEGATAKKSAVTSITATVTTTTSQNLTIETSGRPKNKTNVKGSEKIDSSAAPAKQAGQPEAVDLR